MDGKLNFCAGVVRRERLLRHGHLLSQDCRPGALLQTLPPDHAPAPTGALRSLELERVRHGGDFLP